MKLLKGTGSLLSDSAAIAATSTAQSWKNRSVSCGNWTVWTGHLRTRIYHAANIIAKWQTHIFEKVAELG
jgi:hypothetical protein